MGTLRVEPKRVYLHPSCPGCGATRASYTRATDDDITCLMCGRSVVARVVRPRVVLPPEPPKRGRLPGRRRYETQTVEQVRDAIVALLALQSDGALFADELIGALEVEATQAEWLRAIDGLILADRIELDFPDGRVRYRLVTRAGAPA